VRAGVPEQEIALSADGQREMQHTQHTQEKRGFWDWLFGTDIPDSDRTWYESNLKEGRTALCVRLEDGASRSNVEAILAKHCPLSMEADGLASKATGNRSESATERETRIPVVKEELHVGKRQTEQHYHVRVYPVERPVEKNVKLRDEKVIVERRPIADPDSAAGEKLAAREMDVIERHEEPVVAKRARADEEVVVRKDVREHSETIRDKVRETKVDVDRDTRNKSRT
jgi:stress response protein YsnF